MADLLRATLALFVICLLGASVVGCMPSSPTPSATPAPQTTTVRRGNLKVEVSGSGNLKFSRTADLAFEFGQALTAAQRSQLASSGGSRSMRAAIVDHVYVELGDAVKQGQLLADLDATVWEQQKIDYEKALDQAKADLNNAQIALEKVLNFNSSTSSGTIPDPLDVENKQIQVEINKSKVDSAQKQLAEWLKTNTQIKATLDGYVTAVNVKGGDEVSKGSVAVTIADPTQFEASILVGETDISNIKLGGTATIQMTALSGLTVIGKVTKIAPTATIQQGVVNYQVFAEVAVPQALQIADLGGQKPTNGNPTNLATPALITKLREGLSVTVNLLIEEKKDVIQVPIKAVIRRGSSATVQVLDTNGLPQPRQVKIGASNSQFIEITDGLKEGEQIVTNPPNPVQTNRPITGFGR